LNGAVTAVVAGGPLSLSGVVSGSGSLTETGNGVLVLGASDTFTGNAMVRPGATLQLGCADALPSGPSAGSVRVNGTLDLAGNSTTLDGLWGSGTITSSVSGAVTLTVDTTNYSSTFSGVIEDGSGTVSLTKVGTGTLYLTGANTHSGGTTISAGTLQVGDNTATGTLGTGAVVDNASLMFHRTDTATIPNAISGNGTVTQALGTVVLTGASTYSGLTTINMGTTLRVGGTSGTLGSGEVTCVDDYSCNPAGRID
jgi:fibronectin-binding autotransporter adhesin